MDIEKLKEPMGIPKEVSAYIYKNANHGGSSFCKWLQWWHNKLMIRTFAYTYKRKDASPVLYTEVERCLVGDDRAVRKNLYKTNMGGYHAVFKEGQKSKTDYYGYTYYYFSPDDFDKWFQEPVAGMYAPVINIEYLYTLKKYKYCAYSFKQELKQYLEAYDKDPMVEYFGKAGLKYTAMLGKKAKKDKAFARFIIQNASKVNAYGYQSTWYAYQHNCSFKEAEAAVHEKRASDEFFRGLNNIDYEHEINKIKIYRYAKGTIGNWGFEREYRDYWNACVALGLDMRDTKNSMPNDFNEMHDIRTAEYASLKAKLDRKAEAEFNKKIKATASAYGFDFSNKKFTVLYPHCKSDFEREGNAMHHCVGRMGYDKKMGDGEIVIAFIRLKKEPNKSFCTVEYSIGQNRLLQMRAEYNAQPPKEAKAFIEKWAEVMKANVKKTVSG